MKFHRGNSIKSNMPVKWRGGKGKLDEGEKAVTLMDR